LTVFYIKVTGKRENLPVTILSVKKIQLSLTQEKCSFKTISAHSFPETHTVTIPAPGNTY